ncbi:hypothetical protein BGZ63DRAFT_135900 [Mariannaea sp. PMI_226]|nr:hypothetical protein BGZ63DRAFT_135900 [Mariannaea sp. PMI_226]
MSDILSTLPVELLWLIANKLIDIQDLKSLTEVSRNVRSAVLALFWHAVRISPRSEFHLHELPVQGLMYAPLRYTRHLGFESSFHDHTFVRCPHASLDDNEHEEFTYLALAADTIMRKDSINCLRSFSWNMGTCVPQSILGSEGAIPMWHSSIQSLSLTTSHDCPGHDCTRSYLHRSAIDLGTLRELRSFSWKAPRGEDLDTLSLAIRNNNRHMRNLELDFVDWGGLQRSVRRSRIIDMSHDEATRYGYCVFSSKILRLYSAPSAPWFDQLQVLSLSGIPVGADLAAAIDFRKMRSLTLRKCFGWHLLLEGIVQRKATTSLKTLEVQDRPHESSVLTRQQVLARFLDSFRGLERLFLSLVGPPRSREMDLWAHVVGHRKTLRRYVHHERIFTGIDGPSWPCELDCSRAGLSERKIVQIRNDPTSSSLNGLSPECLGLACTPEHVKPIVLPFIAIPCLKMLHIRQSAQDVRYRSWWGWERIAEPVDRYFRGTALDFTLQFTDDVQSKHHLRRRWKHSREILDLVTWAFGPQGLSSLQYVVFGDFAHGGRETESQICFCRGGEIGTFVEIDRHDSRWKHVVREYRDILEACPSETLFLNA